MSRPARYKTPPIATRLWPRVKKTRGCWLWTGAVNNNGYGLIGDHKQVKLVHRVVFEESYGPIPAGHVVMHRCDVPRCVRPTHLQLGTQLDNIQDMKDKGRAFSPCGTARASALLTDEVVRTIRKRAASGDSIRQMGRDYGVHHSTIWSVLSGRSWSHVK